jgi:ABC-type polysaccharide/polyol phosphate export systems, permease component
MKKSMRYYIDLVTVLTHKELKVRYKSNVLGYLWSIAHPLSMAVVFYLTFKIIMRINIENYVVFLIAGLFPWQWFSNSVNTAPMVFLANASLIKKVSFPRNLIPFVQVMQDMIHFLLSIPVIALFMVLYEIPVSWSWFYGIPVLLILQFTLNYGICLFLSSINLFFRDLERLTSILTMLLFYCTPIFYSENMIPQKYTHLLSLNPLLPFIISWRNLFMSGQLDINNFLLCLIYSIVSLLAGFLVYKKLSPKFAEVL